MSELEYERLKRVWKSSGSKAGRTALEDLCRRINFHPDLGANTTVPNLALFGEVAGLANDLRGQLCQRPGLSLNHTRKWHGGWDDYFQARIVILTRDADGHEQKITDALHLPGAEIRSQWETVKKRFKAWGEKIASGTDEQLVLSGDNRVFLPYLSGTVGSVLDTDDEDRRMFRLVRTSPVIREGDFDVVAGVIYLSPVDVDRLIIRQAANFRPGLPGPFGVASPVHGMTAGQLLDFVRNRASSDRLSGT